MDELEELSAAYVRAIDDADEALRALEREESARPREEQRARRWTGRGARDRERRLREADRRVEALRSVLLARIRSRPRCPGL